MADIKPGTIWREAKGTASCMVLSVEDNRIHYQWLSPPMEGPFSTYKTQFLNRFTTLSTDVKDISWDYAEADRLRKAAAAALAEYNAYAARKPTTAHYAISVPGELRE